MNDRKQNPKSPPSRRRVVKSIVAATGALSLAPRHWKTPLVKSVILPAHAQTSPGECVLRTDEIFLSDGCGDVPNGVQVVFIGTLEDAPVDNASGSVDADGSQWEFLDFDVDPGNNRRFGVALCVDTTLPGQTQVTISATDDNGGECSETFLLLSILR